jgi:hypothetical protein
MVHEDSTRHFQKLFECGTNITSICPQTLTYTAEYLFLYGMSMLMTESLYKLLEFLEAVPAGRAEKIFNRKGAEGQEIHLPSETRLQTAGYEFWKWFH